MFTFSKLNKKALKEERGAAMLLIMVLLIAMSLGVILSTTIVLASELRLYQNLSKSKRALVVADAAIDDAVYRVAYQRKVSSSSETMVVNNATGTASIVSVTPNEIDIFATGDSSGYFRKSFTKAARAINGNFAYGAQVGEGGITMSNNSTINGTGLTGGDVYSGGQVLGAPGVTISGDIIISSGISQDTNASTTACVTDEIVGRTSPNIDYAQSFVYQGGAPDSLQKVSLYLKRNGNPAAANVRIAADVSGSPATTSLATQSLTYSLVATSYGWIDVVFTTPATLTPGTTYWIVFDSGQHASRYWYWCRTSVDAYASGVSKYKADWSTSGAWSTVAGDLDFKLYFGGGVSKLDSVAVTGVVKADTITNATITGDAYYQTIGASTVSGTSYPGSPTPPELALPIASTTIAQWKLDAENGGVINGNCGTGGVAGCNTASLTMGPRKIIGNLLLDNNQTLTLTGVVYVTGTVRIENNATVRCHASYGTKSCMLIADGSINAENNAFFQGSGFAGSYVLLLTTKSGCVGTGTVVSGCATNNSGINVANNVDGALFYASDSMVNITNNAYVTAVVGYKLNLDNNTQIVYDQNVLNMIFSTSGTSTISGWDVNRWSEFY